MKHPVYEGGMEINDKDIIAGIKNGDSSFFTLLFNRYYSGLVVYATHLLESDEHSADIVHDIFMSLWEKRASLFIEISIKSYLFTSVRNRCLNYISHLRVRTEYQESILKNGDVNGPLTWEHYDEVELTAMIDNAINKLPPQCRKVFLMSRFEYKTNTEIAKELEISPRTAEKHIEKALKILRAELKDYLPLSLLAILFQ